MHHYEYNGLFLDSMHMAIQPCLPLLNTLEFTTSLILFVIGVH